MMREPLQAAVGDTALGRWGKRTELGGQAGFVRLQTSACPHCREAASVVPRGRCPQSGQGTRKSGHAQGSRNPGNIPHRLRGL